MVFDNLNVSLTQLQNFLPKRFLCLGHLNLACIKNIIRKKILSVVDCDVTEVTPKNIYFQIHDL